MTRVVLMYQLLTFLYLLSSFANAPRSSSVISLPTAHSVFSRIIMDAKYHAISRV